MSDLSPLSGEERKSNFGAVRSVDDPNRPLGYARSCDAANTFRARAISIPAVDYTIFRNAPVTGDVLLPVGIFELACDHW
jgi:hypothetical protein